MRNIYIDLEAIARNYATLKAKVGDAKVMAVVKANAYGHGMVEVAKKLEAQNVDYLGVADIDEALELRNNSITVPILTWLHSHGSKFQEAVAREIDLGISSTEQLEFAAEASKAAGKKAKLHLKIDTGLGRNGATKSQWRELVEAALEFEGAGVIELVGVFSHLSGTGRQEDHEQVEAFSEAVSEAENLGASFKLKHISASFGALVYPDAVFDMVRVGIALYGLNPAEDLVAAEFGLVPAMKVSASVALVKKVPSGQGISYGYLYRTTKPTTLVLVPFGYAEGLPRSATGKARVTLNGRTYPILARIAMDQFVLDVGDEAVSVGDEVVIFGDPAKSEQSAEQLAEAAGTINYEIVTRIGGRAIRHYL
jgi:alanine racemase